MINAITFTPLREADFPLLLKWLETPHVKAWWDPNVTWTPALIAEKYGPYVQGYKLQDGVRKPMHAYIVQMNQTPVGYFQYYNAYDFPRGKPLVNLPESLAAFDLFIGDPMLIGQGWGAQILTTFLNDSNFALFDHCFVDPHVDNTQAIRAYQKAGFIIVMHQDDLREVWMVRAR